MKTVLIALLVTSLLSGCSINNDDVMTKDSLVGEWRCHLEGYEQYSSVDTGADEVEKHEKSFNLVIKKIEDSLYSTSANGQLRFIDFDNIYSHPRHELMTDLGTLTTVQAFHKNNDDHYTYSIKTIFKERLNPTEIIGEDVITCARIKNRDK